MKTFLTLVKTQLNMNFGISALKYRFFKEKRKRWEPILIAVSIIAGLGPLLAMYSLMSYAVFTVGMSIGQPGLTLSVSFVFGQLIVLIFGIFYVMGAFYFSKDINLMIPLPLRPYEVLGSKFVTVMVNEYITLLPILLPPLIIFGTGTGQGLFYWIKGLFIILAAPTIPLILASLFNILLMRFVNVRKRKDLLTVIGGIFGLVIALGMNFFLQRMPDGNPEEFLKNMIESRMGLIEEVGRRFPPSLWATLGLTESGWTGLGYFALFIGVSVLLFVVLLWMGNKIFYRSVLSGQEVNRKRKILTEEEANKQYARVSSPVWAIFRREWKLLLRTPVYMLNGLTGAVVGPIMLLFMLFTNTRGEEMQSLTGFLNDPAYTVPVALGGLGVMLLTAGINIVASTSVSREGQTLWVAKMIPVSPKEQMTGKFLNAYSLSALGVAVTAVILAVLMDFALPRVVILLLLGLLGSVPTVALNLLVDVLHPKLEWSSPQEAMKQNINGLFGMIVSFLVLGVLAAAAVGLIALQLPEWAVYLALALAMAVLAIPSLIVLFAVTDRQYGKFEA